MPAPRTWLSTSAASQAGEPVRARPVGTAERVIVWCRRKPGFAGLLAALVLVFLAGSSGVLWQWQRARSSAAQAEQNAAAFQRERDTARQEKARAERHLRMVRDRVDRLNQVWGTICCSDPGLYRTGQAVLEEALAFYQELLPEEGNDPKVRREAAQLFDQVAWIHHTLDQAGKAAEAWGRQANLLTSLLEEEPDNKALRMALSHSHRWRGNALRDLGKAREAREAYDAGGQASGRVAARVPRRAPLPVGARQHPAQHGRPALVRGPRRRAGNDSTAAFWSSTAPRSAPRRTTRSSMRNWLSRWETRGCSSSRRGEAPQAEAAVREAVEIHERVLAGGQLKGSVERYAARNFVNLGRILAAAGRAPEAEQCVPGSRESARSSGGGIARVGVPPGGPGADVAPSG